MKTTVVVFMIILSAVEPQNNAKYTALPYGNYGELNASCRTSKDCKPNGYVCRDGKSCQCSNWYIPDKDTKKCLGGVNQKCTYDEHCIEGAFCMNQSICQCKEDTPFASDDGLTCSSSTKSTWNVILLFAAICFSILLRSSLRCV